MSVSVHHVITVCGLTWLSYLVVVIGQVTVSNVQENLQPSLVKVHDLNFQKTPLMEVKSTATVSKIQTRGTTCSTACLSVSSTPVEKAPKIIGTFSPNHPKEKPTMTRHVASHPAQIHQQLSLDVGVTSTFTSSNYDMNVTATTPFLNPRVRISSTRMPELKARLLTVPTTARMKTRTFRLPSFDSDLITSFVGHSTPIELKSVRYVSPSSLTEDIKTTSDVTMNPSSSSKYVSTSSSKYESTSSSKYMSTSSSKYESTSFSKYASTSPTTRPSTHVWARKPTHAGGSGLNGDALLFGGMTPGVKVAIGILITLCILGVVVAAVVAYRRYHVASKGFKSFLSGGSKYKAYNNVSFKNDEETLIFPDRR